MKHLRSTVILILTLTVPFTTLAGPAKHTQLRTQNTFSTPEEVVNYYCSRDSEGFILTGMLDSERSAFTHWRESPKSDSCYISKNHRLGPTRYLNPDRTLAEIPVTYDLAGIGDADGIQLPAPRPTHQVTFRLRKIDGRWKIESPTPSALSPVVSEGTFKQRSAGR